MKLYDANEWTNKDTKNCLDVIVFLLMPFVLMCAYNVFSNNHYHMTLERWVACLFGMALFNRIKNFIEGL